MEKKKGLPSRPNKLEESLICLDFHQLEERLEVSTLVPGSGHDTGDMELENCCTCKIGLPAPKVESHLVADEWPFR